MIVRASECLGQLLALRFTPAEHDPLLLPSPQLGPTSRARSDGSLEYLALLAPRYQVPCVWPHRACPYVRCVVYEHAGAQLVLAHGGRRRRQQHDRTRQQPQILEQCRLGSPVPCLHSMQRMPLSLIRVTKFSMSARYGTTTTVCRWPGATPVYYC